MAKNANIENELQRFWIRESIQNPRDSGFIIHKLEDEQGQEATNIELPKHFKLGSGSILALVRIA